MFIPSWTPRKMSSTTHGTSIIAFCSFLVRFLGLPQNSDLLDCHNWPAVNRIGPTAVGWEVPCPVAPERAGEMSHLQRYEAEPGLQEKVEKALARASCGEVAAEE